MDAELNQGRFHVRRDLSGGVRIELTRPMVVVAPSVAIAMAKAILEMAGAEVIFADPGQTVIRGGNGNGKVIG